MPGSPCPDCGSPLTTVLAQGPAGERQLTQACQECALRAQQAERDTARDIALALTKPVIAAGLVLGLLVLVADHLGLTGRVGFGWRQLTGAEAGFLALVVGLLGRRTLVGVLGAVVMVLSLGADMLQMGRGPGMGWREWLGLLIAAGLVTAGVVFRGLLLRPPARRHRKMEVTR